MKARIAISLGLLLAPRIVLADPPLSLLIDQCKGNRPTQEKDVNQLLCVSYISGALGEAINQGLICPPKDGTVNTIKPIMARIVQSADSNTPARTTIHTLMVQTYPCNPGRAK